MHQLPGARPGAECEKCDEKLPKAMDHVQKLIKKYQITSLVLAEELKKCSYFSEKENIFQNLVDRLGKPDIIFPCKIELPYQEWWRDRPDETTATCVVRCQIRRIPTDEEREKHHFLRVSSSKRAFFSPLERENHRRRREPWQDTISLHPNP